MEEKRIKIAEQVFDGIDEMYIAELADFLTAEPCEKQHKNIIWYVLAAAAVLALITAGTVNILHHQGIPAQTASSEEETSASQETQTTEPETAASQETQTTEPETHESIVPTESEVITTPQLILSQELDSSFKIGEKAGRLVLDGYDDGGYFLKVMDGEDILYEIEMNTTHPGNKDIYLSLDAEQPWLLVYTPYTMQGDAYLSYEVLTWQNGILAEDAIQFRYLRTEEDMPVAEIAAYAGQLSGYLENSRLLVSVASGGAKTEAESEDDYALFIRLLPIAERDIYAELELDKLDSMEEKLTALNEYYKEDYRRYLNSKK